MRMNNPYDSDHPLFTGTLLMFCFQIIRIRFVTVIKFLFGILVSLITSGQDINVNMHLDVDKVTTARITLQMKALPKAYFMAALTSLS